MKAYDGQITCDQCSKILLLKTKHIRYKMVAGITSYTINKVFVATCPFCEHENKVEPRLLSREAISDALKVEA